MAVKFVANVTCDGCGATTTAGVSGTVDSSSCGWSGCGCVSGEFEIDWADEQRGQWHELYSDERGWSVLCDACFRG